MISVHILFHLTLNYPLTFVRVPLTMTGQGLRGPETRLNVFMHRLQRLRLTVRPRSSVRPRSRSTAAADYQCGISSFLLAPRPRRADTLPVRTSASPASVRTYVCTIFDNRRLPPRIWIPRNTEDGWPGRQQESGYRGRLAEMEAVLSCRLTSKLLGHFLPYLRRILSLSLLRSFRDIFPFILPLRSAAI